MAVPACAWYTGPRPLRVCYFGTYRAAYSRNQIMIEGLRRNGVEVIECHEPLWRGIKDRVRAASGGWLRPAFVARVVRTYVKLLRAYRKVGDYDVMVLGYPGQLDVYLARILAWLRHRPLVLDVFMSLYLIASERGLVAQHPTTARFIYWLEKLACLLPDRLILDTAEYVAWFQSTYGVSPDRFRLVPTGADNRVFRVVENEGVDDGVLHVVYYGTFIPNHGIECIVEAARTLADDDKICFELIGQGPEREKAVALARRYGLSNVTFIDWLSRGELLRRVARADICLGAFGTTPQSIMTIQNKIYEGLAMGKPVVTGDAPAIRAALRHGEHVYLVERANPGDLATALLTLQSDPALRQRLAHQGRQKFLQEYSVEHIGERMQSHLAELRSSRMESGCQVGC
jgi:glycosyltransferase involved in cell wall biosynthesis